jgi:hypothetical protein
VPLIVTVPLVLVCAAATTANRKRKVIPVATCVRLLIVFDMFSCISFGGCGRTLARAFLAAAGIGLWVRDAFEIGRTGATDTTMQALTNPMPLGAQRARLDVSSSW